MDGVWHWHEHRQALKRVAVSYTEKYEDNTDTVEYEKFRPDNPLFAEEQLAWLIAHDNTCMVLTHDKNRADYRAKIAHPECGWKDGVSGYSAGTKPCRTNEST